MVLLKCRPFFIRYYQYSSFSARCLSTKHIDKRQSSKKPNLINFCQARHGNFIQERPKLSNPFLSDSPLKRFLKHEVSSEVNKIISDDLTRFSERIVEEIDDLGWECEVHQPNLTTYDAWGKRVDTLATCDAWKKQHALCAQEGIVAIPYEQHLNAWSRLHQMCKLYLYAPSSGLYSCPIAMTDGAAKTILEYSKSVKTENSEHFMKAFKNLTTRDSSSFWTSGQWMTEKKGGSDVAQSTETIAVCEKDFYNLYGYKWFSSATDSNMALTLAKIVQSDNTLNKSDGLTMFYVETKKPNGQLNGIQIVNLKNKLGTRQLPTAELLLDGTIAYKMSEEGRGIASIAHMLNITRFHNSIASVGGMRRMLQLTRDYSHKRTVFGNTLSDTALHLRTLSKMEIEARGCLQLVLKAALLLGKIESGESTSDEELLLRLLSPVMKLYTAKQAVAVASEGLESFGGQGYIEDTRLPQMLRDAQVLPIWEGTTNVLAMDVIRSITKTNFDSLFCVEKSIRLSLEAALEIDPLRVSCKAVEKSLTEILLFAKESMEFFPIAARDIAYSIARTYTGSLLVHNAAKTKNETDIFTAQQWCEGQEMCNLLSYQNYNSFKEKDFKTVMDGYKV